MEDRNSIFVGQFKQPYIICLLGLEVEELKTAMQDRKTWKASGSGATLVIVVVVVVVVVGTSVVDYMFLKLKTSYTYFQIVTLVTHTFNLPSYANVLTFVLSIQYVYIMCYHSINNIVQRTVSLSS